MTCEHEYFKQKRLYFQIADQCDEKNKCTVEEKELTSHLADADEAYLVNPIQMTRHEFYSLPEFTGF